MKVLLLTLILTTIQPTISEKAEDLAKLNNGNVEATTSQLIDWLYTEGGLTDTLPQNEVLGIKKIVEVNCEVVKITKTLNDLHSQIIELEKKKASLDRAVEHQQRINEEQKKVSAKDWHDNVKLTINYNDGSSRIYNLRLYGYIDPDNPSNFVFDPTEQTERVRNLIQSAVPAHP